MTSYKVLSEAVENRHNNLNLIKLIAALLVIVSHAYAFAAGYRQTDWLSRLTGGKGDFGGLAVNVFFFYSGLLVAMSILRNGDGKRYWKRRILRIYPSFIIVTLAIVFLAAPFVTTLDLREYFTSAETYRYLKNLIFLSEHELPGVFVGNVYGTSVNGPIWTIRVEVFCYALCYVFYKMKLLQKNHVMYSVILYMVLAGTLGYGAYLGIDGIAAVIMPVTMFFLGMIYAVYADRIYLSFLWSMAAAAGFIISCILGQVIFACMVFLPYVLCTLAFGTKPKFRMLNCLGESSYEIYLWGGFVGQMITYMFGGSMPVCLNMMLTIPVTVTAGYITNQLIHQLTAKE